jgi:hypothetical protein
MKEDVLTHCAARLLGLARPQRVRAPLKRLFANFP